MSAAVTAMNNKKRAASEAGATACPASKKTTKEAVAASASAVVGGVPGVPGWQYPPLPMGMMPAMPFCMPGNPFFNPFMGMGMFPPFWLPAAAMAAATMPAFAAATANVAAVPPLPSLAQLPLGAGMWPMASAVGVVPPQSVQASAPVGIARTSSGISGDVAIPSTSCTNSVPTTGVQSPASPPPLSTSPNSVCNGPLAQGPAPADDEFDNFIDIFLGTETETPFPPEAEEAIKACMEECPDVDFDDPMLSAIKDSLDETRSILSMFGEGLGEGLGE